jgi:transcription elongation factor GreA
VTVNSHVTVQEEGFDPETYHLVGAKEADPRNGKISNESPIGKALMDHKVGDVVEAETPGGKIKFKILKIE